MKTIREILMHLIPVAIGVYIGVLASNWNTQKQHKLNQKEFVENIVKELESNKKRILNSIEYHEALGKSLDTIETVFTQEEMNSPIFGNGGFQAIPGWSGVKLAPVNNSIYESGVISNIFSGMSFDLIHKINSIYNYQESYDEITKPMVNRLIQTSPETKRIEVVSMMEFYLEEGQF